MFKNVKKATVVTDVQNAPNNEQHLSATKTNANKTYKEMENFDYNLHIPDLPQKSKKLQVFNKCLIFICFFTSQTNVLSVFLLTRRFTCLLCPYGYHDFVCIK